MDDWLHRKSKRITGQLLELYEALANCQVFVNMKNAVPMHQQHTK